MDDARVNDAWMTRWMILKLRAVCVSFLVPTCIGASGIGRERRGKEGIEHAAQGGDAGVVAAVQGLTLVHFSAQLEPCWSHLCLSHCQIDWGKIMHPTYPTKRAYVEPNSGRAKPLPRLMSGG